MLRLTTYETPTRRPLVTTTIQAYDGYMSLTAVGFGAEQHTGKYVERPKQRQPGSASLS